MTNLLTRLFIKNREDVTAPSVRRAYGTMVSIVSMVMNILLFAAKFTVGTLAGSVSITADAVNNLSDAGSQIISLISFRISAKPADREHPFGHARIEYVASMIVSFLILLIGFELLRESVGKIFAPEPPERSWVAVAVLAGSILCKLWLGLFNKTVGMRIDSAVMKATAADCLSDAISTGAVLLSTAVLLIFPDLNLNLDAYMGVIVAVLIMVAGIKILKEAKDSILGEAPSNEIVKQITDVVESAEGALGIHDLTVHNYGPGHVIAALHVEVDGHANVFETHDIVDNIEKRLRTECGIEATIHMDPIVTDDETVTSLREKSAEAVKAIDERLRIHDFRFVRGTTHSNLIFDVVAPFELKTTDAELLEQVAEEIRGIDPTYCTVVTVDRE
jgi:cation diffusion facilitator family transporter